MELSADQQRAAEAIRQALAAGQREVVLVGPAGSGKTTLLRALLEGLSAEAVLLCPTGKAAARLAQVTGRRASTIHRALYNRVEQGDSGGLVFSAGRPPCPPGGLIVCDEASMLDREVHAELMRQLPPGAQVLFVGDREQLPPVSGGWGPDLLAPTAALETIHRQAEQSPILSLATALRERRPWSGWVEGICESRPATDDPVAWYLQQAPLGRDVTLITVTNRRRQALNAAIRAQQGHTTPLAIGDKVVGLVNNDEVGVMNGEVYTLLAAAPAPGPSHLHGGALWQVVLDGGVGEVWVNVDLLGADVRAFQAWRGRRRRGGMERVVHLDHGFCLTVHKAQGSQWDAVGFVSCPAFRQLTDRRALAYTAVTRAARHLVIFQAT